MIGRFGSDKVKREFLAPSITGDMVSCLGVSEAGAGSDVASKYVIEPRHEKTCFFFIYMRKQRCRSAAQ